MRRILTALILLGLATSVSACGVGCRPGHIGPYGGVHPGRCVVY